MLLMISSAENNTSLKPVWDSDKDDENRFFPIHACCLWHMERPCHSRNASLPQMCTSKLVTANLQALCDVSSRRRETIWCTRTVSCTLYLKKSMEKPWSGRMPTLRTNRKTLPSWWLSCTTSEKIDWKFTGRRSRIFYSNQDHLLCFIGRTLHTSWTMILKDLTWESSIFKARLVAKPKWALLSTLQNLIYRTTEPGRRTRFFSAMRPSWSACLPHVSMCDASMGLCHYSRRTSLARKSARAKKRDGCVSRRRGRIPALIIESLPSWSSHLSQAIRRSCGGGPGKREDTE